MNSLEERRNALRYLWLREQMEVTLNRGCPSCISLEPIRTEVAQTDNSGDFIDAAIDAEIQEAFGGLYRMLDRALDEAILGTAHRPEGVTVTFQEAMHRVKSELLPIVQGRQPIAYRPGQKHIGGADGGTKLIRGKERKWVGYWYTKGPLGNTTYDAVLGYGDTWEEAIANAAAKLQEPKA